MALTKNRPDLNETIPTNSDEVVVLWVWRDFEFRNSISVNWVRGLSLELTNSVPDGGLAVETSRVDDLRVNRDTTRVDLLLGTEESLLERSINDVPKSHGLIPRGREEDLVVRAEAQISNVVIVSSQSVLWSSNLVEVVSSVIVKVPDKNLLVSSTSDKEGSRTVLKANASRGDARDLSLVTFNELFR